MCFFMPNFLQRKNNFFLFQYCISANIDDIDGKEGENRCVTPFGTPGRCEDLSVCPGLLLNLTKLRESLCFKRLFSKFLQNVNFEA